MDVRGHDVWQLCRIQLWRVAHQGCKNTQKQTITVHICSDGRDKSVAVKKGASVMDKSGGWSEKSNSLVFLSSDMKGGTCFLSTCFWNIIKVIINNTFIQQSSTRKTLTTASLKNSWHCIDLWKLVSKFVHTKAILRVSIYHHVLTEASNISRCCCDCAGLCLFRVAHIVWNSFHLTFMLFLRDSGP